MSGICTSTCLSWSENAPNSVGHSGENSALHPKRRRALFNLDGEVEDDRSVPSLEVDSSSTESSPLVGEDLPSSPRKRPRRSEKCKSSEILQTSPSGDSMVRSHTFRTSTMVVTTMMDTMAITTATTTTTTQNFFESENNGNDFTEDHCKRRHTCDL
eukprot:TRINITY_DN12811_c0_g1_i1.p1 TRINITY_DN12811_c0_g1~~TRINITY_DN12811_c0_g1_i1.p1  ORF type:complete len:157 (-),score=35.14 TRINITY_DN12811_c0_g1_i1:225-695(-)